MRMMQEDARRLLVVRDVPWRAIVRDGIHPVIACKMQLEFFGRKSEHCPTRDTNRGGGGRFESRYHTASRRTPRACG